MQFYGIIQFRWFSLIKIKVVSHSIFVHFVTLITKLDHVSASYFGNVNLQLSQTDRNDIFVGAGYGCSLPVIV